MILADLPTHTEFTELGDPCLFKTIDLNPVHIKVSPSYETPGPVVVVLNVSFNSLAYLPANTQVEVVEAPTETEEELVQWSSVLTGLEELDDTTA